MDRFFLVRTHAALLVLHSQLFRSSVKWFIDDDLKGIEFTGKEDANRAIIYMLQKRKSNFPFEGLSGPIPPPLPPVVAPPLPASPSHEAPPTTSSAPPTPARAPIAAPATPSRHAPIATPATPSRREHIVAALASSRRAHLAAAATPSPARPSSPSSDSSYASAEGDSSAGDRLSLGMSLFWYHRRSRSLAVGQGLNTCKNWLL